MVRARPSSPSEFLATRAAQNFRADRILAEKTCCNRFGFSLSVRANAPFGALWVGRKSTQKR
jgi:hypothetical protein